MFLFVKWVSWRYMSNFLEQMRSTGYNQSRCFSALFVYTYCGYIWSSIILTVNIKILFASCCHWGKTRLPERRFSVVPGQSCQYNMEDVNSCDSCPRFLIKLLQNELCALVACCLAAAGMMDPQRGQNQHKKIWQKYCLFFFLWQFCSSTLPDFACTSWWWWIGLLTEQRSVL